MACRQLKKAASTGMKHMQMNISKSLDAMEAGTFAKIPTKVTKPPPSPALKTMAAIGNAYVRIWQFFRNRLQTKHRRRAIVCSSQAPVATETKTKPLKKCWSTGTIAALWTICEQASEHDSWTKKHVSKKEVKRSMAQNTTAVQPTSAYFDTKRVSQAKCLNCNQLYFTDMVPTEAAAALFCGLDCKSSYEYVHALQDRINAFDWLDELCGGDSVYTNTPLSATTASPQSAS